MRPLTAVTAGNDRRGPTPRSAGFSAKPGPGSNWVPEALGRSHGWLRRYGKSRCSASVSPPSSFWSAWWSAPVACFPGRLSMRHRCGDRPAGERAALPGHSLTVRRADGAGWGRADGERSEPGIPGLHLLHRLSPGKPEQVLCLSARHERQYRPSLGYGSSADLAECEPHQRTEQLEGNVEIHGAFLYPNGDILVNMVGAGTVKLDRCSNVLWTVDRPTHHHVEPLPDGGASS